MRPTLGILMALLLLVQPLAIFAQDAACCAQPSRMQAQQQQEANTCCERMSEAQDAQAPSPVDAPISEDPCQCPPGTCCGQPVAPTMVFPTLAGPWLLEPSSQLEAAGVLQPRAATLHILVPPPQTLPAF